MISWIGHVERMEGSSMPKRVMREKIYTRRKKGCPKVRWLDDVQEDRAYEFSSTVKPLPLIRKKVA